MNNAKKISVPVCCICQKVINGDAEWIKTKRGTVLYMHRECVRKGKENEKINIVEKKSMYELSEFGKKFCKVCLY